MDIHKWWEPAGPDQALKYATADVAMEIVTEQVPLDALLGSAAGDPKRAASIMDAALKQYGIRMTGEELNWLGRVAAEASKIQQYPGFAKVIALERLKGLNSEQARTAASRVVWQQTLDWAMTSKAFEGVGGLNENRGQGNQMDSVSGKPAEAIDIEAVPKYDKENGQEALDNGLDGMQQTDEGDVRNGSPYSLDKSSQSGTIIQDAIDSGQISTKINREKQLRHTKDNHGLGKSYLFGDLEYAQGLVDKYSGTGDAISTKGKWTHRERIIAGSNIGIYVDSDGNETESNQAIIVYSRTGTHMYPARKENLDET